MEDAVVLGAVYSRPDPPPFDGAAIIGMTADDGVAISYDPGNSQLTIQSPKLIKIISTDIDIESGVRIKGDIDINGNVAHSGDVRRTGNVRLTGNITHTGSITTDSAIIGGIVFGAHKHLGVMGGTATSGLPTG
jgi:phage baseplate assembly protein V